MANMHRTLTVLINGTSITVAAEAINDEFGISDANFPNSYWPITSWTLGGGIFMMVLLPLMEDFGVRWAYLVSSLIIFYPERFQFTEQNRSHT